MKFLRYIVPLLLFLPGLPGISQISFSTNPFPAVGCDSLEVTFTFNNPPPALPITTVDWDFGNGATATGTGPHVVKYDAAGMYTVNVLVNNNTSLTPKVIRVYPTPSAAFFWSDSLELGSYTVAMINPPQMVDSIRYTFQWFVEGDSAGNARGIIYHFPQAGEYQAALIVTDGAGCADTSARRITVEDVLDCPNVFTPNDDGFNDYFMVSSNGISVYKLEVFTQSGILVFRAEAPILIWDGRNLSGQKLSAGTYFYIIKPVSGSGPFEKKGFVELFR